MNALCDLGYCAEFNTRGAMIQDHYATDCTAHEPPCPSNYNSAEAYKCNVLILLFWQFIESLIIMQWKKSKHFEVNNVINMPKCTHFNCESD